MPRYIIKLVDPTTNKDYYMEWSTVVDAPVTNGMGLEDFKKYYRNEYGEAGMDRLDERLKLVEKNGTSSRMSGETLQSLLSCNVAGDGDTELDMEGILAKYCRPTYK